jgi:hypothetical protein
MRARVVNVYTDFARPALIWFAIANHLLPPGEGVDGIDRKIVTFAKLYAA